MKFVAVYGTLRPGQGNHGIIVDARHISTVTWNVPYEMHHLGYYPALKKVEDNHKIVFDLFELDDKMYKDVEMLEGYPDYYSRDTIRMFGIEFDVYYIEEEEGDFAWGRGVIAGGDWVDFLRDEARVAGFMP